MLEKTEKNSNIFQLDLHADNSQHFSNKIFKSKEYFQDLLRKRKTRQNGK